MTKGWRQESARHALARKGIETGEKKKTQTPLKETLKTVKNKNKLELRDSKGNKLASLQINVDGIQNITISHWKTFAKGKGYGRLLIKKLIKSKPDLWMITTDGFTEKGHANIMKALPNWRLMDWRRGTHAGWAILMHQDAIDWIIDEKGGRYSLFRIDPSFHSKKVGQVD